jgi:hypothetical protein
MTLRRSRRKRWRRPRLRRRTRLSRSTPTVSPSPLAVTFIAVLSITELSAGAKGLFALMVTEHGDSSNSDLGDSESNVSDLDPDSTGKKKVRVQPKRHTKKKSTAGSVRPLHGGAAPARDRPGQAVSALQARLASDPEAARLARALKSLEYDDNPPARPSWLTGLRRPLPHPDLDDLQDFEVQTRLWFDEIARLERDRRELPASDVGEWHYEHFGSTKPVKKRVKGTRGSTTVWARGVWRLMVNGKRQSQRLDELPVDLAGDPLGWVIAGEYEPEWVEKPAQESEEEPEVPEVVTGGGSGPSRGPQSGKRSVRDKSPEPPRPSDPESIAQTLRELDEEIEELRLHDELYDL